ncbi:MAG TPA: hypothetical protein VN541_02765 [Tepidisphaeraceae bacterium]|nr:hypothetical protein [Tepidisphaeraceae bacterium]
MTAPSLVQVVPSRQPSPTFLSDWVLKFADRHRHVLLLAVLGLYALGLNGHWRLEPDSALYLTIGRNLATGGGYTYHGEHHHLAFPGPPLLFAATFKLFHSRSLLPPLLVMWLIGLATLGLTYRLFLLHAGRPTAVLMTFGVGISRLFYRYSFELLSDMPFLLGVMAFLVGYEAIFHRRRAGQRLEGEPVGSAAWYDWVLLFGGLGIAVVMRPAMWALLVAVILALAWSAIRGPRRLPQLLTCLAVVMAAVLFWKFDPRHTGNSIGQYEDALFEVKFSHINVLLHQMIFDYAPRLFEATLSQALFGARLGAGLNTIAGIGILILVVGLFWHRPLWGLWVAMTLAIVLVAVKPLDRYFLEVLPLLVFAWWRGIRWLNRHLRQPWGDWVFLGLLLLGAIINLSRTGEFITEQRWTPFLNHYKEGRFVSTQKVVSDLQQNLPREAWVIAPPKFGRILTFLSHRRAVEAKMGPYLDPARQGVYVLEPLDPEVEHWLRDHAAHLGPTIGPTIQSKFDPEPWRLHKVEIR